MGSSEQGLHGYSPFDGTNCASLVWQQGVEYIGIPTIQVYYEWKVGPKESARDMDLFGSSFGMTK